MKYLKFVLLAVFVVCFGCSNSSSDKMEKIMDVEENKAIENQYSFLALGDSYTIGESVLESERWPEQLVSRINFGQEIIDSLHIIARTGWTTDELSEAMDAAKLTDTFDFVSLLIGVNNQFRGYEVATYEREFRELLVRAIGLCTAGKANVFVLSIPDYGVTPFGASFNPEKIATELDEYNRISKLISEELGVAYFDITPISRLATNNLELLASDRLHPSGSMYAQWVDLVEPWIIKKIQ